MSLLNKSGVLQPNSTVSIFDSPCLSRTYVTWDQLTIQPTIQTHSASLSGDGVKPRIQTGRTIFVAFSAIHKPLHPAQHNVYMQKNMFQFPWIQHTDDMISRVYLLFGWRYDSQCIPTCLGIRVVIHKFTDSDEQIIFHDFKMIYYQIIEIRLIFGTNYIDCTVYNHGKM